MRVDCGKVSEMVFSRIVVIVRAACALSALIVIPGLNAGVITFEDLSLAPNSAMYGPMPGAVSTPGPYGGNLQTGTFSSGGAQFTNQYYDLFDSWSGFAYSNMADTVTADYSNQFSSFAGGDRTSGTGIFGVAYGYVENLAAPTLELLRQLPSLTVPTGMVVTGAYLTNTTYAALTMQNGDAFAKKFGGVSGDDPDYLRVRAYGVDAFGDILPDVPEFYLSDFRFADNAQDYILNTWELFDLSSLTGAVSIHFNLETTDVGMFGSNTPMFFAIDDLQLAPLAVPEPSSALLALAAAGGLWRLRRRKQDGAAPDVETSPVPLNQC